MERLQLLNNFRLMIGLLRLMLGLPRLHGLRYKALSKTCLSVQTRLPMPRHLG
jgi:hypothetical protein